MYSQNDLDEAVAAGALSADAAAALRAFVDSQRASPAVDEENFRLITGFNDIFVADRQRDPVVRGRLDRPVDRPVDGPGDRFRRPEPAGSAGRRRDRLGPGPVLHRQAPHGAAVDPAAAGLCRRRSSRPSASAWCSASANAPDGSVSRCMAASSPPLSGAVAAGAAWLHWKRFRVPITVAAGAAAVARQSPSACWSPCSAIPTVYEQHHPRLRPAARRRRLPVRDALGFSSDPARVTRRIATSPSGSTCWRRR